LHWHNWQHGKHSDKRNERPQNARRRRQAFSPLREKGRVHALQSRNVKIFTASHSKGFPSQAQENF